MKEKNNLDKWEISPKHFSSLFRDFRYLFLLTIILFRGSFNGKMRWDNEGKFFHLLKQPFFKRCVLNSSFPIATVGWWIFLIPPLKVNDKNFPFFNACHGIFLNYCWKTGGTNEKVTLSYSMGFKLSRQNQNRWEGVNVNTFHTIDIKKWHWAAIAIVAMFRNKNFFPIPITLSEIPYTKKKLFPDWTFPKSI